MRLPHGMTEEETIKVINKVIRRLVYKFVFGYYDKDDIYQQAFIFAIDGLERYDNERSLENFLWTHIKNRLCTFKRDEYGRHDKPCLSCKRNKYDKDNDICKVYDDIFECKFYSGWIYRTSIKHNLLNPININNVKGNNEEYFSSINSADDIYDGNSLVKLIDENLPCSLRADYLKMISGIYIPKHKREKVQEAVDTILNEHGYDRNK